MTVAQDPGKPAEAPRASVDGSTIEILRLLTSLFRWGDAFAAALVQRSGYPDVAHNMPVILMATLATDGPLRPVQIAGLTGLSSGGVTALLDRLEGKGLIHRWHDERPDDRRAVVVELTDTGRCVALDIAAATFDPPVEVLARLDELFATLEAVRRRRATRAG